MHIGSRNKLFGRDLLKQTAYYYIVLTSNFQILTSLQPDGANLWQFHLLAFIVWISEVYNIRMEKSLDAKEV